MRNIGKILSLAIVFSLSSSLIQVSYASGPTPKPTIVNTPLTLLASPKGSISPSYGIIFNSSAKEKIDIWEDFQCANCAKFETTNHDFLNQTIKAGKIKVTYHTLSFLGADSVTMTNAAACAADEGKFLAAHDQFFALQATSKNSGIWSKDYLLQKMAEVGLTSSKFIKCVNSSKYLPWVSAVQKTAASNRVAATPTVLVNGKEINRTTDYFNAEAFQAAVANPASIVAPTPIPSPTSYKLNFSVSKIFGVEPVIGKPSGPPPTTLGIGDLIVGTGTQIQSTETVTVQYVLMEWSSGKVLESSWKTTPFTSALSGVIPGWRQGLLGMKVGGRRILIIPPDLAYGANGSGSVGPNQTLVFVIDLLAVAK
jgi:protein-disulfide isomerase